MPKPPERGRELPPNYKHIIDLSFHRKLTKAERVKLLAGYVVKIDLSIACEHKPGKFQPVMNLELTKETDPKQA